MVNRISRYSFQSVSNRKRGGPLLPRQASLCIIAAFIGYHLPVQAQHMFEQVLPGAGIDHVGITAGVAWTDYDGDGDPDIWLTNHGNSSTLYVNNADGTFSPRFVPPEDNDRPADTHGVAWADFDNDGDKDLLELVGASRGMGARANRFFVNNDDHLVDQATTMGLDYSLGRGRNPLWFDYNSDGILDVLLTNHARPDRAAPHALFENKGGLFTNVTEELGADLGPGGHFSAGLLSDVIGDHTLELLLFTAGMQPAQRVFTLNSGGIEQISDTSPLRVLHHKGGVVSAISADFNGDLRSDLFISRSRGFADARRLSNNKLALAVSLRDTSRAAPHGIDVVTSGDVRFDLDLPQAWGSQNLRIGASGYRPESTNVTLSVDDPRNAGLADFDTDDRIHIGRVGDAWLLRVQGSSSWLFATVTSTEDADEFQPIGFDVDDSPCKFPRSCSPMLLISRPDGSYVNDVRKSGLDDGAWCPGVAAGDFNNDMTVDLYRVCAFPSSNATNRLSLNQGDGTFTVAEAHGADGTPQGRGAYAALADYDDDGFLDIYVTNGALTFRGPDELFRNVGNTNSWLKLNLIGTASNRDGIGARVELMAGGVTQLREQTGGQHFVGQDDSVLHFGLGDNTVADEVVVYWPSGNVQTLSHVDANQTLDIVEESKLDRDDIELAHAPTLVPSNGEVAVSVTFAAPAERDVWLSLKATDRTWWGGKATKRVNAGRGTVTFNFPMRSPPLDSKLRWTARLLPRGGTWRDAIVTATRSNVRVLP